MPACVSFTLQLTVAATSLPANLLNPLGLDAGTAVHVTSSGGFAALAQVPNNNPRLSVGTYSGMYAGKLATYVPQATYTIEGDGGADVGSFSIAATTPPPFTWTNKDGFTSIQISQPLTFTWTGGDPQGYVNIEALSYVNQTLGVNLRCVVPTTAGQFTIPARVLSTLPVSAAGSANIIGLTSYSAPATYMAPGLDLGTIGSTFTVNQATTFH